MKICVVTGGGGNGLGTGLCLTLARRGYVVWVTDVDEAAANRAADAVVRDGGTARAWRLDVTDRNAVEVAFARVVEVDGRIDGLVNSAGVGLVKPVAEIGQGEFEQLLATDLAGTWNCCRSAIPQMRESGGGSIVNIGSIHVRGAAPGYAVYAAAKSAVATLSRGIAMDYGRDGIRCNVVHPGLVDGAQTRRLISDFTDPDRWIEHFVRHHQMLRTSVRSEDVGAAVAFLLGDDARVITGTELVVDAGSSALLSAWTSDPT